MHKNKIIFLSPVEYFKGGAERSLFDLTANPNIEPIVICPETGPILERAKQEGFSNGIISFGSIRNIQRPFSFVKGFFALKDLWKAAFELKKKAKILDARIVHSNGLKAHMINCVSRCFGGPKAVLHIRDIPFTRSEKLAWHIMCILSDAVIVVSKACWPNNKLPSKVYVIHNGTEVFEPLAVKQTETLNIAFIGRIHPAKGLHLLIDWTEKTVKKIEGVRLIIRGSFSEDTHDYKRDIRQQINDLDLNKYIDFQGFVDDPAKVYSDIDIVCVPSHIPDPLPRSVMEAMAYGIPVLAYPAGGILDMIDNGKTGYLVSNHDEFIDALQALRNISHKNKIISEAQKKIREKFTIHQLHQNMTSLYVEL